MVRLLRKSHKNDQKEWTVKENTASKNDANRRLKYFFEILY